MKRITIIIIFLFFFSYSCSPKKNITGVHNLYSNFYSKIALFQGTITYLINEKVKTIYKVDYRNGAFFKVQKIDENNNFINNIVIRENKIIISNQKKDFVDTPQNRIRAGLPLGDGINPYYFIDTDFEQSKLTKIDDNTLHLIFEKNKLLIKSVIKIFNDKIKSITVTANKKKVYDVIYSNFQEIQRGVFFPMEYKQVIYHAENIKSIQVLYTITQIELIK